MIKPIDWISCEQCKKDLQEFKDLTPSHELSEEMIETLDAYTLFLELKQLRRSKKIAQPMMYSTRGLDNLKNTVIC
jgi:hypothetical protein